MDRQERIYQVTKEIENTISRCVAEYDITLAELIGILEIIKFSELKRGLNDE